MSATVSNGRWHTLPAALALALLVNLVLAVIIFRMVTPGKLEMPESTSLNIVDFIRLKPPAAEPELRRDEPLPEPPPPEPPPVMPELPQQVTEAPPSPELKVDTPALNLPFRIAGAPSLGPVAAPITVPTGPVAAPAPAPAPPALEFNLTPTSKTPPTYPPRAQRAGIEGVVTVEFTIDVEGKVKDPIIVKADPPDVFDEAVLKAIRKWTFAPRIVDGKPVERRARQDVRFTLKSR